MSRGRHNTKTFFYAIVVRNFRPPNCMLGSYLMRGLKSQGVDCTEIHGIESPDSAKNRALDERDELIGYSRGLEVKITQLQKIIERLEARNGKLDGQTDIETTD